MLFREAALPSRIVAIVGLGPRGLSVLERLAESARHSTIEHITVHAIDSHAPGSGRVWRPEQARELLMNTVASQVTMFTDDSVTCKGPIVPGPSLHEWTQNSTHLSELRRTAPDLEFEAARLGPNDYPTRGLYGRYLHWVLEHVSARLPGNVHLVRRRTRATAVVPSSDGRLVLHTADGGQLPADQVVLSLGHLPGTLGEREVELREFARRNDLRYVPMSNPADVDLSSIEADQNVLVRGLGLNFFDYLALLTTGRGGRFEDTGAGLEYLPSGEEPHIHAGSRRGIPYHARGHNQKGIAGRHKPQFITPAVITDLQQRAKTEGLDFERDIWPLVCREAEYVFYAALLAQDGKETGEETPLASELRGALIASPQDKPQRLEQLGIETARFLDWAALRSPCQQAVPSNHARFTAWLLDYLEEDVRNADGGNVLNPLKAALDAMRDLRNEVRQVVEHGQVLPHSYRDHVDASYTPLNAFVSIGPPARRVKELIALIRAGVVSLAGPEFTVEQHPDGHFTGSSPALPGSRRDGRVLIEARLPAGGLDKADDPLANQLIEEGVARHHSLERDGTTHHTGALDVTARPYRVISAKGVPHPGLYAFGVPTEGVHWATAAGIRPGVNSVILGDADAIARSVLEALTPATASPISPASLAEHCPDGPEHDPSIPSHPHSAIS